VLELSTWCSWARGELRPGSLDGNPSTKNYSACRKRGNHRPAGRDRGGEPMAAPDTTPRPDLVCPCTKSALGLGSEGRFQRLPIASDWRRSIIVENSRDHEPILPPPPPHAAECAPPPISINSIVDGAVAAASPCGEGERAFVLLGGEPKQTRSILCRHGYLENANETPHQARSPCLVAGWASHCTNIVSAGRVTSISEIWVRS
jgi:hypothetical protein